MPPRDYDVVIVGARCAGATLATLLARRGAKVLVVDKDRQPSDHILSTHFIPPPAVDVLDEVGVGAAMRAVTPPARIIRLNADNNVTDLPLREGREAYCPRRERLDGLLQQAAVDAGATLIDRTRVTALLREGDRVVGVGTEGTGGDRKFTAGLVVGADGRHSTVATLVAAEEYLGYDARRTAFWAYWDAPSDWNSNHARGFDAYFGSFGDETAVIFPTDRDQLVIGSWPPVDRAQAWRADPERMLRTVLASEPVVGPIIGDRPPVTKVRGVIRERFYFRRAAGRGWALVGDAGHHKDFVIGDGMAEALLQARTLAAAIAESSDAALARWWRARDVAALPVYLVGKESGAPYPLPAFHRAVLLRLNTDPRLMASLVDMIDRRRSPFDLSVAASMTRAAVAVAWRRPRMLGQIAGLGWRAVPIYAAWLRRRLPWA